MACRSRAVLVVAIMGFVLAAPPCLQAGTARTSATCNRTFLGDARDTNDASNVAPGHRVQIRLQRDNDVSNNFGADFFIPSTLSVVYPTP